MNPISLILLTLSLYSVCHSKDCSSNPNYLSLFPKYADSCGSSNVEITYANNFPVNCGNYISVVYVLLNPKIVYDARRKCKYATIILFDPESIILPPFRHWETHNVPTESLNRGFRCWEGQKGAYYLPPLAPSGDHRYTFFIYCQKGKIPAKPVPLLERFGFDVKSFAKSYGLGNPIACNFFNLTVFPNSN